MTQELEPRYISPENAALQVFTNCGIERLRMTDSEKKDKETNVEGFKKTLNAIRNNMGEAGQDWKSFEIIGIDAERNLKIIPSFRGTDRSMYIMRALEVTPDSLTFIAVVQSSQPVNEELALSPIDLLSRMREQ